MSTAIMQQLSEMFLVFLESDLSGMLALFLCGVFGWSVTKYFNCRYYPLAQIEAKTKSMDTNHQDIVDSAPKSKRRARKSLSRSPKAYEASSTHGASIGVGSKCSPIASNTGVVDAVANDLPDARAKYVSDFSTPRKGDDARVAKIMAKKAERKARKLQEQQALQTEQEDDAQHASKYLQDEQDHAVSSSLASSDVRGAPNQDSAYTHQELCPSEARVSEISFYIHIISALCEGTDQNDVTASDSRELDFPPHTHEESDKISFNEEDVNCVSTADEEEQCSSDAEVVLPKASSTPCGEPGKMTSSRASEATRSEEDNNSVSDGYSTSEDIWGVGQDCMPPMSDVENSIRVRSHIADDGWMTSFEDAGNDNQLPVSLDQEPAFVHIDATTGNEVWFEPVQQNDDGAQLYSDGLQLYQAVCVRVEDLMSSDTAFQVNLSPQMALQRLPTDAPAFHSMSNDATFQHVPIPTTLHHLAGDLSLAAVDGSCCQRSTDTAGMQMQNFFGEESLQNRMASEDFDNGCIFNLQQRQDQNMCSPLLKADEEDETWNVCWDFVSSAWSP